MLIDSAKLTKNVGSSTLTIATLDPLKPILLTSYIGDSGYVVYRRVENEGLNLLFKSEEHTHSFNFPF